MSNAAAKIETVQEMIDRANKKTDASRRRVFAKKATNQKIHENLSQSVDLFIDTYQFDPNSSSCKAAFRGLLLAATLSRRSLQP